MEDNLIFEAEEEALLSGDEKEGSWHEPVFDEAVVEEEDEESDAEQLSQVFSNLNRVESEEELDSALTTERKRRLKGGSILRLRSSDVELKSGERVHRKSKRKSKKGKSKKKGKDKDKSKSKGKEKDEHKDKDTVKSKRKKAKDSEGEDEGENADAGSEAEGEDTDGERVKSRHHRHCHRSRTSRTRRRRASASPSSASPASPGSPVSRSVSHSSSPHGSASDSQSRSGSDFNSDSDSDSSSGSGSNSSSGSGSGSGSKSGSSSEDDIEIDDNIGDDQADAYLRDARQHVIAIKKAVHAAHADPNLMALTIDSISELGVLCWLGGDRVQRFLGESGVLQVWARMLRSSSNVALKQCIIENIGMVCRRFKPNQDLLGKLDWVYILAKYVQDTQNGNIRRWACDSLFVLLCNHAENQAMALDIDELKTALERVSAESWSAWQSNSALNALRLLGYAPIPQT